MIVAVLSALGMVFYVGFWLVAVGYTTWAGSGSQFGVVLMTGGVLCWIAGIVFGLRVIAALLGWI